MVSPDLLQKAIIAKLKADGTLTAWLGARSSADEIREESWQGTEHKYPCVRVDMGQQEPDGTGNCRPTHSIVNFSVDVFSDEASSQECDQLLYFAFMALSDKKLSGDGFAVDRTNLVAATPSMRISERLWRATARFTMNVRQT